MTICVMHAVDHFIVFMIPKFSKILLMHRYKPEYVRH